MQAGTAAGLRKAAAKHARMIMHENMQAGYMLANMAARSAGKIAKHARITCMKICQHIT